MKKKQNKNEDKIKEKKDLISDAVKKLSEQKIDLEEEIRDYIEFELSDIYISDVNANIKKVDDKDVVEIIIQSPNAWSKQKLETMVNLLKKKKFVFFGIQPGKYRDFCYIEFKFEFILNSNKENEELPLNFDQYYLVQMFSKRKGDRK